MNQSGKQANTLKRVVKLSHPYTLVHHTLGDATLFLRLEVDVEVVVRAADNNQAVVGSHAFSHVFEFTDWAVVSIFSDHKQRRSC